MAAAPLVLASRSPRRVDLLRRAGIPFEAGPPPDVDETPPPGLAPEDVPVALAERKARRVAALLPGRAVLAADTIVLLDGRVLGKPADAGDARRMLAALSGRTHRVVTGVALAVGGRVHAASEAAEVTFRALAEAEIRAYVAGGEPLDKAGAYAIQGGAAGFVTAVRGDPDAVVGLPVARVRDLLRAAGLLPAAGGGR